MSTMTITIAANLGLSDLVYDLLAMHEQDFDQPGEDWRLLTFLCLHCAIAWKLHNLPYEPPFVAQEDTQVEPSATERAGVKLMVNAANLIQAGDHEGLLQLKARSEQDVEVIHYATQLAAMTLGRIVHRAHYGGELQSDT